MSLTKPLMETMLKKTLSLDIRRSKSKRAKVRARMKYKRRNKKESIGTKIRCQPSKMKKVLKPILKSSPERKPKKCLLT